MTYTGICRITHNISSGYSNHVQGAPDGAEELVINSAESLWFDGTSLFLIDKTGPKLRAAMNPEYAAKQFAEAKRLVAERDAPVVPSRKVDILAEAVAESTASGKPVVYRFAGHSKALMIDAQKGTVTFVWKREASYSDDPLSFTGGLLPRDDSSVEVKREHPISRGSEIREMARKLGMSLTRTEAVLPA